MRRSFQASTFLRPTNSLDVVSTYFLPATAGGDHSFKFGYRWRSAHSTSLNHRGGFIDARFTNGVAELRRHLARPELRSRTSTRMRSTCRTRSRATGFTLNVGLRFDRQDDAALAGRVPENPFFPTLMPAIDFQGADAGVVWNGLLAAHRRHLRPQAATAGPCSRRRTRPTTARWRRASSRASSPPPARCSSAIPWTDTNGDKFVQPNEVNTSVPFLEQERRLRPGEPDAARPRRPASIPTSRTIAPASSSSASTVRSVRRWPFGASYIWRKYDQLPLERSRQLDERELPRGRLHGRPTCPAGARCEADHLLRADDASCRRPTSTRTVRIVSATSTASN